MAPHPLLTLLSTAASTLHPTRTLVPHLQNRQSQTNPDGGTVVITPDTTEDTPPPAPDDATTLSGGAIAGIVIGSIAGFLILVWVIRSCTNLGAPSADEAVPGRPWYGSVRDEYPPRHVRGRSRNSRRSQYGYGGGGDGGHYHHHHHGRSRSHGGWGSRSRSRRVSVVDAVPVQEVAPVVPVVVRDGRSRSRGSGYYGQEGRRSRSRGSRY